MAYTIAFVPAAAPTQFVTPLDQIPEQVRKDVEEIYAGMKASPNGRMSATFDTVEEKTQWMAQVKAYCEQRPGGAVRFRVSPVRNAPKNQLDFRITDFESAEQKEARLLAKTQKATEKAAATPAETPATEAVKPSPRKAK